MKKLLFILPFIFLFLMGGAQIKTDDLNSLKQQELAMMRYAEKILQGRRAEERLEADSIFTRLLVTALKTNYSFDYPFDSLASISMLVPDDSTFRIFTWQLYINENVIRQHGAIQMQTPDGSLKLFPLIDKSGTMDKPQDSVVNNFNWIGAVYYKLIQTKHSNKTYYTLLGYDENNIRSSRKMIDVLTFENWEPVFGGSYFSYKDGPTLQAGKARYIMTYKKYAGPRLNFDPELDLIIVEHLISETGEPEKEYTYIPDGDYEGFKWEKGLWVHIDKVFTFMTPEGEEPVPHPILDEKGNIDESKLKENRPPVRN